MLPIGNPDLFWHLSAARRIVETGAVPRADWLSFTMPGAPWVDFEWLSQLLWLAVHGAAGLWGLWALKAAALAAVGLVFWRTCGLYGLGAAERAPWLLLFALALLPANDLRPENLSLVLFSLEWWWLERGRLGRPEIGLVPEAALAGLFFALWANLHAGFASGLLLLALAAASAARERRGRLACMIAVGASAALANPAGWRLYAVLASHAAQSGRLGGLIREWQAPGWGDPWLAPYWVLFLVAFAAIAKGGLAGRQPRCAGPLRGYGEAGFERRAPLVHAAAVAVFGAAAARHVRLAPYFAVLAAPCAAAALAPGGAAWGRRARAAAAVALGGFFLWKVAPQLRGVPFSARYAPEGVARFLERESPALEGRRMFHPVEWGGFFGYRLGPSFPVFADGRYLFHPLLAEVHEARATPEAFGAFLDRWRVDVVVLRPDFQRVAMSADLPGGGRRLLRRPPYLFFVPKGRWALAYWDGDGMVFARRGAVDRGWLARHEYRLYRPGDSEAAEAMVQAGFAGARSLADERARWARELENSK
ncbi:MAG: hypothetical protein NTX64_02030 [Elusimicrobia bacterium]|nr:hypothetical protein [Elusimicrobiota bacterium]